MNAPDIRKTVKKFARIDLLIMGRIFAADYYRNGNPSYRSGMLHAVYMLLTAPVNCDLEEFEQLAEYLSKLSESELDHLSKKGRLPS